MLDRIALIFLIIGGVNLGSIGIFGFDMIGWMFGGQAAIVTRIIYSIIALASLWSISLLFRPSREFADGNR